ncbi:MAG TPA: proline dehydrogenase family protein [Solirubrobacteraceae bacterium]|nr:proline dehydrogenase family protein [Solirubrobacteraceae bacterium]
MSTAERAASDAEVLAVGRQIAANLPRSSSAADRLDGRLLKTVAEDGELRAALFRFTDVRPACAGVRDLGAHLMTLLEEADPSSRLGRALLLLARTPPTRPLTALAAGAGVQHLANRFIVGRTVQAALPALGRGWESGVAASVDLLGEASVSEEEAEAYVERCLDALRALDAGSSGWPARPALESDSLGPLPRANLSVKVTALTPDIRLDAPRRGIDDAMARLRRVLRLAAEVGAHVHIDMETLDSRETVLGLVLELLAEPEFEAGPSSGLVLQAYLRDSPEELDEIIAWVGRHPRRVPLTVRLVKGAYWDHEVVEARAHGWEPPVFTQRADSDRNFEELTRRLLDAHPRVRLALGSHNLRSIAHGLACLESRGLQPRDLELQVLRGLGDDLAHALSRMGLRVRSYSPVGDLLEGMAYLVRRMLENTANDSFLAARSRGAPLEELLAAP